MRNGGVLFFANHHHHFLSAPSSELQDRRLPTHHRHDMLKTSDVTRVVPLVGQGRARDARWTRGRIYQGGCTRYARKSLFLIYLLTKTPEASTRWEDNPPTSNPSYFDTIRRYPLCHVDFRHGKASHHVELLDLDRERRFPPSLCVEW